MVAATTSRMESVSFFHFKSKGVGTSCALLSSTNTGMTKLTSAIFLCLVGCCRTGLRPWHICCRRWGCTSGCWLTVSPSTRLSDARPAVVRAATRRSCSRPRNLMMARSFTFVFCKCNHCCMHLLQPLRRHQKPDQLAATSRPADQLAAIPAIANRPIANLATPAT